MAGEKEGNGEVELHCLRVLRSILKLSFDEYELRMDDPWEREWGLRRE